MDFISNKTIIDMSAAFQEEKYQANITEDSILYMDNLHTMKLFSAVVNTDDYLDYSKEYTPLFRLHSNLNTSLLEKKIVKSTMQQLQTCLKLPQYLLSNDTNTVELVGSTTI